ncbi:hypothetical protein RYA05_00930 [Pseudomonas syringae pv. actinidiae]|nr:hypothetical protein [Pseudomonas syringae pv. actinidiae]
MWLKKLLIAFKLTRYKLPAMRNEASSMETAKKLVQRYSRGNLNLKLGRYVTASQIDARKKKLSEHSF